MSDEADNLGAQAADELTDTMNRFAEDEVAKVFKELKRVKDDPRLLVMVTHGMVEVFVHTVMMKRCKNAKRMKENGKDFTHSAKLLVLNELGLLADDTFDVLDWFRKLRNKAAHNAIFRLTADDLGRIDNPDHRKPENFYELCTAIIGDVWGAHIFDLLPEFAPTLHDYFYRAVAEADKRQFSIAEIVTTEAPITPARPPRLKPPAPKVRLRAK